jgi:hypothetical protein
MVSNAHARTYVVDTHRNTVYRADPYEVANLCAPRVQTHKVDSQIAGHVIQAL